MSKEIILKSKVQPKPTRGEIIDALTRIEMQRRDDEKKAGIERRKTLGKELEAEIFRQFMARIADHKGDVNLGSWYSGQNKVYGVSVNFDFNPTSDTLKKLKEYHALPERFSDSRFADVRKQMLEASRGITQESRVHRLLKDVDTRKSLEAILDSLSK